MHHHHHHHQAPLIADRTTSFSEPASPLLYFSPEPPAMRCEYYNQKLPSLRPPNKSAADASPTALCHETYNRFRVLRGTQLREVEAAGAAGAGGASWGVPAPPGARPDSGGSSSSSSSSSSSHADAPASPALAQPKNLLRVSRVSKMSVAQFRDLRLQSPDESTPAQQKSALASQAAGAGGQGRGRVRKRNSVLLSMYTSSQPW